MSVSSYQSEVSRLQRDIGDLRSKISSEGERAARLNGDIASIMRSMDSSSGSLSSLASKVSQLESKSRDAARINQTISNLEKQLGDKLGSLGRAEQNLASARTQETRRQQDEAKRHETEERRRAEEQLKRTRQVTKEYERQSALQTALRRQAMIDLNKLPTKIKVLFCAADPKNANHLALDEEVRSITAQIRASKHRDSVELISIWAVRTLDLLQALNEHEPQVVHFSGHGSASDEIIFLDAIGNAKPISKTAIVETLASTATNLRVVVFNTCFSHKQAEEITQHIDAAIGMTTSIGDDAARSFAAQFYSAIGFGFSIQKAYDQAKAAVRAEDDSEGETPMLFVKEGADANDIILVKP